MGRVHTEDELWTSAHVAAALRVGVSSVKRWTDEGELECVRTPGRHRRYQLNELHRFAALRRLPADRLPPLPPSQAVRPPVPARETMLAALVRGDAGTVEQLIQPPFRTLPKRAAFLDRVVGEAMRTIGRNWEEGTLTVDEEHRASYIIAEAVDRLRTENNVEGGPRALLICPPNELHDLPLRMIRLLLEWNGWTAELLGSLPWLTARQAIARAAPTLVAYTSRSPAPFASDGFSDVARHCRTSGVRLIAGGEWARGGLAVERGYLRFRTLRGFQRWLAISSAES